MQLFIYRTHPLQKYECITIDKDVSCVRNDVWHPLDNYVYYGWLNTYWPTRTLVLLRIYVHICVHMCVCVGGGKGVFLLVSLYVSIHLHFQILTTLKMLTILMIGYLCFKASTLLLLIVHSVHVTTCVLSVPCLAQYIRTDFFGIRVGFIESD
jgi:hypothetical protein